MKEFIEKKLNEVHWKYLIEKNKMKDSYGNKLENAWIATDCLYLKEKWRIFDYLLKN